MSDFWAFPTFFAIKGLSYVLYCYGGAAWFHQQMGNRWLRAGGFALLRIGMGLAFGLLLYLLFTYVCPYSDRNNRLGIPEWFGSWIWTYVLCYVPIRAIEWTFLAYLINGRALPRLQRAGPWTAGGVLISFFNRWNWILCCDGLCWRHLLTPKPPVFAIIFT